MFKVSGFAGWTAGCGLVKKACGLWAAVSQSRAQPGHPSLPMLHPHMGKGVRGDGGKYPLPRVEKPIFPTRATVLYRWCECHLT